MEEKISEAMRLMEKEIEIIEKQIKTKEGRFFGINACRKRKILLISPNGERIEVFGTCKKFCEDNKLSAGNMYAVLRGKRRHNKGWTGQYLD